MGTGSTVSSAGAFLTRLVGAARLDRRTYQEVEHDAGATAQAAAVVALGALSEAIGSSDLGLGNALGALTGTFAGWLLWAGITYVVGARILGGTCTWAELLRTLGFAQVPRLLGFVGIVPLGGWLLSIVLSFWILVAGVVAIREALDFGTGRAIATVVLGWAVVVVLRTIFSV